MSDGLAEVVWAALTDDTMCHTCWRRIATDEEWETVPEGGRPDLCWDSPICADEDDTAQSVYLADAIRAAGWRKGGDEARG